jgi:hypothetical protein
MARTSRKGIPPRNPLLASQWPAQSERREPGMFEVFFRSPNRDRLQIPHWRGRVFSIKEGTRLVYASSAGRRLILQLDPLPEVTRLWPFAIEIPIRTPVRGQMAVLFPDLVIALYDGRWAVVVCRTTAGMASAEGKSAWASIQAYAERYGLGCLMTDGTLSTADLTGMPLPEGFTYRARTQCGRPAPVSSTPKWRASWHDLVPPAADVVGHLAKHNDVPPHPGLDRWQDRPPPSV